MLSSTNKTVQNESPHTHILAQDHSRVWENLTGIFGLLDQMWPNLVVTKRH